MAGQLEGPVAVVTGSCSGNGRAIALAIDHASDLVNSNAICPGFLETAMVRPYLDDAQTNALLHSLTPWPRMGTDEDVARVAAFVAADAAQWMSGSMLTVDGAYTAR